MTKPKFIFAESDNLANVLRQMRKSNKWTLKQVAEMTGISLSFLSDIERGRTSPSFDTLQKLANVYCKGIVIAITPTSDWPQTNA